MKVNRKSKTFKKALLYYALVQDGGPGSGNFGHSGRPGYVGGSGKGGGKAYRTGTKESGFVGIHKSKQFESIAMHASAHKDYHSFVSSLSNEQKSLLKQQYKDCGTKESLQQYTQRLHNMLSNRGKKPVIRSTAKIVEGKNIVRSFQRRKDKFPHEINDVINQQGFDGKPRIVNSDEFDQIIKDHPEMPVLFRSYAAPNQETIDAYDAQLEGGEWYVDCGTGGAQYGQGMYTAGVYYHKGRTDWSYADAEMRHYRTGNIEFIRRNAIDEMDSAGMTQNNASYRVDNPPRFLADTSDIPTSYYEIGHEDAVPCGEDNYRDVTQPDQEYYLSWETGTGKREGTRVVTDKDGYLYYPSTGRVGPREVMFDLVDGDDITIAPVKKVNIAPKATTRRMTLDPSAKIITHEELEKKRKEVQREYVQEFISGIKDPDPYIEAARQYNVEHLLTRNVDKGAVEEVYGLLKKDPEAFHKLCDWHGIKPWSPESKIRNAIADQIISEVYHQEKGYEQPSQMKRFFEFTEKTPAFQREVDRIKKQCAERARKGWKKTIEDRYWTYKEIPSIPHDNGVFAAMLGYDAINAEGHGLTGSYTVVLNRTKVILDKQPWEVD